MSVGYCEVWVNAGGKSFYMSLKIHAYKRLKGGHNTRVFMVGEWLRVKDVWKLNLGDKMFELVSGNVGSDGCLSFNVTKLV